MSNLMYVYFLSFILFCTSEKLAKWSYFMEDEVNPYKWHEFFPSCAGMRQSPIDLRLDESQFDPDLTDFVFSASYNKTNHAHSDHDIAEVYNDGHTIRVTFRSKEKTIQYGNLKGVYQLDSINFHWGRTARRGSEHMLGGERFPLEIQFVHFDQSRYKNMEEAISGDRGVAILSVFAKTGPKSNGALDTVLQYVEEMNTEGVALVVNEGINTMDLIPAEKGYFRYDGSLTTPPCTENVVWTVFKEPIIVKTVQLVELQELGFEDRLIRDNYRPLQPTNSRKVTRNFEI